MYEFSDEETDPQERVMNSRYREICVYLWRLIHHYVNVSPDNIALMVGLFEKAVDMTHEVAYMETDPTLSEYLQRVILDDAHEIRQHIGELIGAVLSSDARPGAGPFQPPAARHDGRHSERTVAVWHASPQPPPTQPPQQPPTQPPQRPPATDPTLQPRSASVEENRDEARKQAIQASRREPMPGGLASVSGLQEVKQLMRQAVILPTMFPNLFQGGNRPWTRVLLYGPPGTGKTLLAHAVASEANAQFYAITSADLLSAWIGESEKLVRELFRTARGSGQLAVVFVDEVDGLCRRRGAQEADHTRRVKTELLVQMETLGPHVFLLAATNCPWDLDPAFVRRFQRRVFIPLPDSEARLSIMRQTLQRTPTSLSAAEWETLADLTAGYSGSDLADLTKAAMSQPINQLDSATHWLIGLGGMMSPTIPTNPLAIKHSLYNIPAFKVTLRGLNLDDFLSAIASSPKSISKEDMDQYQQFNDKYA